MNEWFNALNVIAIQIVPKLFEIIDKQYSVLKGYERQIDEAKQLVYKKGNTPIEQLLNSISYQSYTDKTNNFYNFMKQQTKIQFDRFHILELLEQQNKIDVLALNE